MSVSRVEGQYIRSIRDALDMLGIKKRKENEEALGSLEDTLYKQLVVFVGTRPEAFQENVVIKNGLMTFAGNRLWEELLAFDDFMMKAEFAGRYGDIIRETILKISGVLKERGEAELARIFLNAYNEMIERNKHKDKQYTEKPRRWNSLHSGKNGNLR